MSDKDKALDLAHKRLAVRDADGDGKVTLSELEQFYVGDDQLKDYYSAEELKAMANEYFTKLDVNKDGFIELSELM